MIDRHLVVLLVVLPLLGAPLALLVRQRRAAYGVALAAAGMSSGMAIRILVRVVTEGPLTYALGGWAAPWGIEYRVDVLGAVVAALVAGVGLTVLVFSPRSLAREVPHERHYLFYPIYLLCLTGLLGMTVTGDLFNLFVFLEIASISSYVMVGLGPTRRALTAAFRYLVLGTIGATFYLIGVGLLYQLTGTLNMTDVARLLPAVQADRTLLMAFAFMTLGVGLKAAMFPLHLWLPDAYAFGPSVVSAFLAATSTKVSVYVLARLIFSVFGAHLALEVMPLGSVLLLLGTLGAVVASAVAIFQTDARRMLAYSSVAQIGYMIVGLSFNSVTGLTGGLVHLVNHGLTKGGMFLAMACMAFRVGTTRLEDLQGIGQRMPATTAAWVLGGLGLIGVPATAGFVTKWYLFGAAVERGAWVLVVALATSSLLAVAYIWRMVETAYFRQPLDATVEVQEAPFGMLLPTWLLIGATLYLGVFGSGFVRMVRSAATSLLGIAP